MIKILRSTTNNKKGKKLTDESIEKISILANPEEKGYARQNGLIKDEWIV